jgi:helicase MOV-10
LWPIHDVLTVSGRLIFISSIPDFCRAVAVTRAQALLIVVGDPTILSLDPLWRSFLTYVHSFGGWTGPAIPWDPQTDQKTGDFATGLREAALADMNDFTRRIQSMTMDAGDDEADVNVDRPWREDE